MKKGKVSSTARWILGLMGIIFGANHLFPFMPPLELSAKATTFMTALVGTGYIFPVVGFIFLFSGILLVSKRAVPLALLLLAPLSVNIFLFHLFLDPANIMMALIVTVLNVYLGVVYFDSYEKLFQ